MAKHKDGSYWPQRDLRDTTRVDSNSIAFFGFPRAPQLSTNPLMVMVNTALSLCMVPFIPFIPPQRQRGHRLASTNTILICFGSVPTISSKGRGELKWTRS